VVDRARGGRRMIGYKDYVKAAAKLQLALKVALINGKFSDDVKQFLSKVDTEAEQLIGGVDEDILELFTQRR
jgi:hypothetical protein